MKKILVLVLLICTLANVALAAPINYVSEKPSFINDPKAEWLEVVFLGMGAADAIIIRDSVGYTMLVDAGPFTKDEGIIDKLKAEGVEEIDMLFASHSHDDHVGGMIPIMEQMPVKQFVTVFEPKSTRMHTKVCSVAKKEEVPIVLWSEDMQFNMKGIDIWTDRFKFDSINNQSAQLHITHGDCSILLPGDIEAWAQKKLAERLGDKLKADIMKSPHHGISPVTLEFLDVVKPDLAILTNGFFKSTKLYVDKMSLHLPKVKHLATFKNNVYLYSDGQAWYVYQDGVANES